MINDEARKHKNTKRNEEMKLTNKANAIFSRRHGLTEKTSFHSPAQPAFALIFSYRYFVIIVQQHGFQGREIRSRRRITRQRLDFQGKIEVWSSLSSLTSLPSVQFFSYPSCCVTEWKGIGEALLSDHARGHTEDMIPSPLPFLLLRT